MFWCSREKAPFPTSVTSMFCRICTIRCRGSGQLQPPSESAPPKHIMQPVSTYIAKTDPPYPPCFHHTYHINTRTKQQTQVLLEIQNNTFPSVCVDIILSYLDRNFTLLYISSNTVTHLIIDDTNATTIHELNVIPIHENTCRHGRRTRGASSYDVHYVRSSSSLLARRDNGDLLHLITGQSDTLTLSRIDGSKHVTCHDGMVLKEISWKHPSTITCATEVANGVIITGCTDGSLHKWNLFTDDYIPFPSQSPSKNQLLLTISSHHIAVAVDQHIMIWDTEEMKLEQIMHGYGGWVTCMAISHCHRYLYTGHSDRHIYVWDLSIGQCIYVGIGHKKFVTCIVTLEDSRFIATGSNDSYIYIWYVEPSQSGPVSTGIGRCVFPASMGSPILIEPHIPLRGNKPCITLIPLPHHRLMSIHVLQPPMFWDIHQQQHHTINMGTYQWESSGHTQRTPMWFIKNQD